MDHLPFRFTLTRDPDDPAMAIYTIGLFAPDATIALLTGLGNVQNLAGQGLTILMPPGQRLCAVVERPKEKE